MLQRCSLIRVGRNQSSITHHCQTFRRIPVQRAPARRHASTSNSTAKTTQPDGISPLTSLTDELNRVAPRFDIDPDSIEIIRGPTQFYEVLKSKILNARKRIYLSTLYIGKSEHELIATIRAVLRSNPELKISFLSDALRGTRETPGPTTASLLAPLITEFGTERVQIRMYHTPNLTGLRKRLVPKRINEGWGLQHMKLYGIDDEIILSGANLSNDYFTNRLDRYHLFRSAELTQYYFQIHDTISSMSFDIQPAETSTGYTITWPKQAAVCSPLRDPKRYNLHASQLLTPLFQPSKHQPRVTKTSTSTTVYPVFQMTPLFAQTPTPDASTELPALTALLRQLQRLPTCTTFTAGYFNPSSSLVSLLLSSHPASNTTVIAASPYANGFYGSKGVSGLLPPAYTLLCKRFLEEVQIRGLSGRVKLLEWRRGTVGTSEGWTYHAKGVWVTLAKAGGWDAGPCVTLIGSSNYTKRSYTLDLEANAVVVTTDEGLKKRFGEEVAWLKEDAREAGLDEFRRTERRVGVHVRIAMWITKLVGGAL